MGKAKNTVSAAKNAIRRDTGKLAVQSQLGRQRLCARRDTRL